MTKAVEVDHQVRLDNPEKAVFVENTNLHNLPRHCEGCICFIDFGRSGWKLCVICWLGRGAVECYIWNNGLFKWGRVCGGKLVFVNMISGKVVSNKGKLLPSEDCLIQKGEVIRMKPLGPDVRMLSTMRHQEDCGGTTKVSHKLERRRWDLIRCNRFVVDRTVDVNSLPDLKEGADSKGQFRIPFVQKQGWFGLVEGCSKKLLDVLKLLNGTHINDWDSRVAELCNSIIKLNQLL